MPRTNKTLGPPRKETSGTVRGERMRWSEPVLSIINRLDKAIWESNPEKQTTDNKGTKTNASCTLCGHNPELHFLVYKYQSEEVQGVSCMYGLDLLNGCIQGKICGCDGILPTVKV